MKFTIIKQDPNAYQLRMPKVYLDQSGISSQDQLIAQCQKGKITLIKIDKKGGEK